MVDSGVMETEVLPRAQARPTVRRRRRSLVRRVSWVYLAGLVLLWAATRLIAEGWWLTTLLLYLPQVVYLAPLALLTPWAFVKCDGRALAIQILAALLVAWPMMGYQFSGGGPAAAAPAGGLRVMTWNIHGGTEGVEQILAEVQRHKPDLVLMQEAKQWTPEPLIRPLREGFAGWHTYHESEYFLASRHPIRGADTEPLYNALKRPGFSAVIDTPQGPVRLFGVHFNTAVRGESLLRRRRSLPGYLYHTGDTRAQQAATLRSWIAEEDRPLLVMGDFNTPPAGRIYGSLAGDLQDCFGKAGRGWGFTYPTERPLLRIDHIFASPHWDVERCWVGGEGSDHRPVIADVTLRESVER